MQGFTLLSISLINHRKLSVLENHFAVSRDSPPVTKIEESYSSGGALSQ